MMVALLIHLGPSSGSTFISLSRQLAGMKVDMPQIRLAEVVVGADHVERRERGEYSFPRMKKITVAVVRSLAVPRIMFSYASGGRNTGGRLVVGSARSNNSNQEAARLIAPEAVDHLGLVAHLITSLAAMQLPTTTDTPYRGVSNVVAVAGAVAAAAMRTRGFRESSNTYSSPSAWRHDGGARSGRTSDLRQVAGATQLGVDVVPPPACRATVILTPSRH